MNLLVPNLGSTSFRYQLLDMPAGRLLASGRAERVTSYPGAIQQIDTGGGVPAAWRECGGRRYGFHGASHEYVSVRVPEILQGPCGGW